MYKHPKPAPRRIIVRCTNCAALHANHPNAKVRLCRACRMALELDAFDKVLKDLFSANAP